MITLIKIVAILAGFFRYAAFRSQVVEALKMGQLWEFLSTAWQPALLETLCQSGYEFRHPELPRPYSWNSYRKSWWGCQVEGGRGGRGFISRLLR